ncbi:MAG: long-chain fatty acid--CoA ligase [Dysgonamonadaceae bacterium]|jgi:long-chain acyl-CoA synthetase|nr:long-chain fatty acid--CoA ligase [Dysgonamonadaceae bacterium]
MQVKRLFDIPDNYLEKYPEQDAALVSKVNGKWNKISIQQYVERINILSYAMLALGIGKGDRVAIVCGSRPEWNILDFAVMQIGAVSVPIYPTISQEDYEHILNHAEMKMIVFDSKIIYRRIEKILPNVKTLTAIYTIGDLGTPYPTLDKLEEIGRQNMDKQKLDNIKAGISESDLASIVYTSGTTGKQKGVMMSHANIVNQLYNLEEIPAKWSKRALSFLPLCHAYERMLVYLYQYLGMSVYYAESLGTIAENIKEINPTMMTCVPRLLDRIYDKLYLSGKKLKFPQKQIYYWAFNEANKFKIEDRNFFENIKHKIADKLIYSKWRAALGGNFDIVVSGGSAIRSQVAAFFSAIGMPVFEGYGLTETSPVIAVSRRGYHQRRAGTVGMSLPGVEVKISDEGEIICRGHNVMMGYYKDDELTAQVIDQDGWFHTGDLGKFTPEGLLMVTGRLKNLFKTSFGKYVNPEVIEAKFSESPYIANIIVLGENQKFAAALIVPEFENLKIWCNEQGIQIKSLNEAIDNKDIIKLLKEEVQKYNTHFGDYEQIRNFRLIADEWTSDNFLSQTLKIKRNIIIEYYKETIDKLFA